MAQAEMAVREAEPVTVAKVVLMGLMVAEDFHTFQPELGRVQPPENLENLQESFMQAAVQVPVAVLVVKGAAAKLDITQQVEMA